VALLARPHLQSDDVGAPVPGGGIVTGCEPDPLPVPVGPDPLPVGPDPLPVGPDPLPVGGPPLPLETQAH